MVETITSSPGFMNSSVNVAAIRFNPSVVPRVNTISLVVRALINLRTVSRAFSWKLSRLLAQPVDATVHIGVGIEVFVAHGVEHAERLLCRCGVIEINQWLSVNGM